MQDRPRIAHDKGLRVKKRNSVAIEIFLSQQTYPIGKKNDPRIWGVIGKGERANVSNR